jgi:teichuronic acid biosynthesis glycosyltransferase TuaC
LSNVRRLIERVGGLPTWEHRDPAADVLVVTNMWPDAERPVYGIFIKRQVDSLIEAGVRCDVLYVRGYRSPLAYPWGAAWFLFNSVRIRRRYRLIHAHAGETALVVRCAVGTPVLVSYCGDDLLGDPAAEGGFTLQSRIRAWVIRNHSRLLTATITKSAEMERALPPRVREANTVLPNGVDVSAFHPMDRRAAREQVGWADDELVALFGATRPWIPRKRLWLAQAACELAAQRLGRQVRIEVVADVPPDRMPALMNACDCLLMTSSIEGSPNVVKEAIMCNLPVVATPAGDVGLLLDGVEPSWVCEPDPEPLADALVDCLSRRARSDGHESARWLAADLIAERLIGVYRGLAPIDLGPAAVAPAPDPALSP